MAATIPTSSLALTFTTPSSTPQVTPSPLPSPLPPTSLLVRVHAAALNPCDTQMLHWPLLRLLKGAGPKGLGCDYSGTVVAVGGDCKDWRVGDEVFGLFFKIGGEGTIREYLVVDPATDPVVAKPASVSHEQAASIPLVALTAFTCLEWLPPPHEDGTPREVVVVGASGGTGVWVTQLAKKHHSCNVTAICSGDGVAACVGVGGGAALWMCDFGCEEGVAGGGEGAGGGGEGEGGGAGDGGGRAGGRVEEGV